MPAALEQANESVVSVRDVIKEFGPLRVLDGVGFDVAQGQVAAIYFALCYPLSLAARALERKAHAGR